MSSERLHECISASWSVAEHRTRKRANRSDEDQAEAERALKVLDDARKDLYRLTDRQFAAKYPEITKRAVTFAMWEKIKP